MTSVLSRGGADTAGAGHAASRPAPGDRFSWWARLRAFIVRHTDYFRLHLAAFILLGLVGGSIIYGIELAGDNPVSYVDALFTGWSAVCVTGLTVINPALLRPGSTVVIALLLQIGGVVLMSLIPVLVRRQYYKREFGDLIKLASGKSPVSPSTEDARMAARLAAVQRPSFDLPLSVFDQRVMQYRAMNKLVWIIPCYVGTLYLLAFIILSSYLSGPSFARHVMLSNNVTSAVGWAGFHILSAFNNAGFSLFANNLVPLQWDPLTLLVLAVLMLCGGTMYPVMLRVVVRTISRFSQHEKDVYEYLLIHPRECFTHLFPAVNTWILLLVIVVMNVSEFALFLGLDWNAPPLQNVTGETKVLMSFFQSVATRTAGFRVVDIGDVSPAMHVLELLFMYLAVVPVLLTLRSSTVVEEEVDEEQTYYAAVKAGRPPSMLQRLWNWLLQRNFLLRESALLFCLTVAIFIIEDHFLSNDPHADLFAALFEIVSAYGTVGLSYGYPGTVTSLSARWQWGSKLLLCVVMLMGRHRGLPYRLDAAVTGVSRNRDAQLQLQQDAEAAEAAMSAAQPDATERAVQRSSRAARRSLRDTRLDSELVPRSSRFALRRRLPPVPDGGRTRSLDVSSTTDAAQRRLRFMSVTATAAAAAAAAAASATLARAPGAEAGGDAAAVDAVDDGSGTGSGSASGAASGPETLAAPSRPSRSASVPRGVASLPPHLMAALHAPPSSPLSVASAPAAPTPPALLLDTPSPTTPLSLGTAERTVSGAEPALPLAVGADETASVAAPAVGGTSAAGVAPVEIKTAASEAVAVATPALPAADDMPRAPIDLPEVHVRVDDAHRPAAGGEVAASTGAPAVAAAAPGAATGAATGASDAPAGAHTTGAQTEPAVHGDGVPPAL